MRMTKEHVYQTFRMFCKKASKVSVDEVNQVARPLVSGWKLDYQRREGLFEKPRMFGGYIIIEVSYDGDGKRFEDRYPFGDKLRSGREMLDVMNFCISMLEILRIDDLIRRQKIPLADNEGRSGIMDAEQRMRSRR